MITGHLVGNVEALRPVREHREFQRPMLTAPSHFKLQLIGTPPNRAEHDTAIG